MRLLTSRSIRTGLSALSATALLTASLAVVGPNSVQAAENSATLAGQLTAIDGNLNNLNGQIGETQGQVAETNGKITSLDAAIAAKQQELAAKQALLKEAVVQSYQAEKTSSLEVLAANSTLSSVMGQQHYRSEIADKTKKAAEAVEQVKQSITEQRNELSKKRDGLVALESQLTTNRDTVQAQASAKLALLEVTKGEEASYQQLVAAEKLKEQEAAISSTSTSVPTSAPSAPPSGPPSSFGGGGNNPYPFGQCTWYVYSATGRGQNGNAGTWRPTSSTPGVGKIMIWRPGQGGASGAGHVGVVIGVSGNMVTIRHMNWGGAFGQVTTGNFPSTGMFY